MSPLRWPRSASHMLDRRTERSTCRFSAKNCAVQGILALIQHGKVPLEEIRNMQADGGAGANGGDDDEDDEEEEGNGQVIKQKQNMCFKLLAGVFDPARMVRSS